MNDALQDCAEKTPAIPLFTDVVEGNTHNQEMDFTIGIGEPDPLPVFTAQIAKEEILVIAHPDVAVSKLSSDQLIAIFTGNITNWKQVGGASQNVLAWIYPDGNAIQRIFNAVLKYRPATSQAMLAPDPSAMIEGVGKQPGSIGYIPKAWLTSDVKTIELDARLQSALLQPVLAMADRNPQGAARRLIGCLQTGSGRQILQKHYQP